MRRPPSDGCRLPSRPIRTQGNVAYLVQQVQQSAPLVARAALLVGGHQRALVAQQERLRLGPGRAQGRARGVAAPEPRPRLGPASTSPPGQDCTTPYAGSSGMFTAHTAVSTSRSRPLPESPARPRRPVCLRACQHLHLHLRHGVVPAVLRHRRQPRRLPGPVRVPLERRREGRSGGTCRGRGGGRTPEARPSMTRQAIVTG